MVRSLNYTFLLLTLAAFSLIAGYEQPPYLDPCLSVGGLQDFSETY